MNNAVVGFLAFVSGAALGAFITYKVVDKKLEDKYEARFQEELESVKERFTVPKNPIKAFLDEKGGSKVEDLLSKEQPSPIAKPSLKEAYARTIGNYKNYSNVEYEKEKDEDKEKEKSIYVVTPEEFASDDTYETQELTFYADGILADEDDTILNPDEVVGKGSLDRMGEYEDDTLHVRNDIRKLYYEVLVDERSYEEATGKTPHLDGQDEED